MANTLGRIEGSRCGSFICNKIECGDVQKKKSIRTSSSKLGRIFRARKPSENRPNTLVRPFMKAIFSSRGLEAKVDRSRKLRVEIEIELKNGLVESVDGVGLEAGCRARSRRRSASR